MSDPIADLISFIDRSPTPYHVVAESAARLRAAGYQELGEDEIWELAPGDRRYLERNGGSLIAFEVGAQPPSEAGFRIVGAHTDSPNLRLKPLADVDAHGYQQLGVEPYGGVLLHTWLDRDLSLAGRVSLRTADGVQMVLLDFARPLLRIPSLAIHLDRDVTRDGLKLNPQKHLAPVMGLGDAPPLRELVTSELRAQGLTRGTDARVLAFDLMVYDSQTSGVSGPRGEFIHAPRLDNLASCHAGLRSLAEAGELDLPDATRVLALYDHEEVGSRSAQGAAGPVLEHALDRIVAGFKGGEPQGLARALARSVLISVDMAHAVHPNYADRHEPGHQPRIGHGPVIKTNANQAYATDAASAGLFATLCAEVGVEPQHFVSRSDLACGSTIGPITAARLGVRAVDVGNPMLSMHSCREMAGTADVAPMIAVLAAFFSS
ncbi:MAG: M18 family aminopeptidase [Myxococcota bacterium]|nr:M18 family aminopeptidase [Myxococcota bacterium]